MLCIDACMNTGPCNYWLSCGYKFLDKSERSLHPAPGVLPCLEAKCKYKATEGIARH